MKVSLAVWATHVDVKLVNRVCAPDPACKGMLEDMQACTFARGVSPSRQLIVTDVKGTQVAQIAHAAG